MKRRTVIFIVSLCCAVALTLALSSVIDKLFVERHEYTTGAFRGFKIGTGKEEVLAQINLTSPKAQITPIPDHDFVVSSKNLDQLQVAYDAAGLQIFNYRGLSIRLSFQDDHISEVAKSVPAANLDWFHVGETKGQAMDHIARLLRDDPSLELIPIVQRPGGGAYELEQLSAEGKTKLLSFDSWEFSAREYRPVGAVLKLYFTAGRLTKIIFWRARIELP
jgi:hypothetical protein